MAERQYHYAVESPSGFLFWFTLAVRKADSINTFVRQHDKVLAKPWSYWWREGYRVVHVGKVK